MKRDARFTVSRAARLAAPLFLLFLVLAGSYPARAEEKFPSRPIDFIVPWGPGGGSDQTARQIAKMLEPELKVSVPVINVPGATGTAGMTKLLAAPADGYSICILAWDTFSLLASSSPKWTMNDFIPLAIVIQLPSGFYVPEGSRFKTWADLEKEAKAKPDSVKVAISGFGSPDDITIGYFASKGLKLRAVPYAKPGERYAALLGNHADVLYSPAGNIKSQVDSKQMRPLIFFHPERLPAFKDIPSSKELGYDITLPQRRAIIVKAGTGPQRVKILSDALAKIAADPEYKAFLQYHIASEDSFVATREALKLMESDLESMKRIVAATQMPAAALK